ncbi:hypothetical protein K438DRAFT_497258 [Mycena galopus ATCC 62051]|nr:hypothetical protein K438DRAFT_497258 [Mycena galopus ATCC 62051]
MRHRGVTRSALTAFWALDASGHIVLFRALLLSRNATNMPIFRTGRSILVLVVARHGHLGPRVAPTSGVEQSQTESYDLRSLVNGDTWITHLQNNSDNSGVLESRTRVRTK